MNSTSIRPSILKRSSPVNNNSRIATSPTSQVALSILTYLQGCIPNSASASMPSPSKAPKVHFHTTVKVVLVPTRTECHKAGLGEVLWWATNDYTSFKEAAVREVGVYAAVNKIDVFQAIAELYQPIKESVITLTSSTEKTPPQSKPPLKTVSNSPALPQGPFTV